MFLPLPGFLTMPDLNFWIGAVSFSANEVDFAVKMWCCYCRSLGGFWFGIAFLVVNSWLPATFLF